jgi:hypothetical protein
MAAARGWRAVCHRDAGNVRSERGPAVDLADPDRCHVVSLAIGRADERPRHALADRRADRVADRAATGDPDAAADGTTDEHAAPDCATVCHADRDAQVDRVADTGPDGHADRDSRTHTRPHADPDPGTDADPDSRSDARAVSGAPRRGA